MSAPPRVEVHRQLLSAWLSLEGASAAPPPKVDPEAPQVAWASAWARIGARRTSSPSAPSAGHLDGLLRIWAGLPPGARDLLALRVLGGIELAPLAELSGRPLARIEREWLLLGRRMHGHDPNWPARLRLEFLQSQALPEAPAAVLGPPARAALMLAGISLCVAAVFAPQLHYALLLDPAQQRLQAPPNAPTPVVESVPLSAVEFALWADPVEFSLLAQLDLLLWRLGATAESSTPAAAHAEPGSGQPSATGSVSAEQAPPQDLPALQPWLPQWPQLAPAAQAQLVDNARRWEALDAAGQARFKARAQGFIDLAPLARAELRERFERYQQLDPELRQRLQAAAAALAALPVAEQARLRAQFSALPLAVRRGLLAGSDAGLAELARDAFAFVPEDQRHDIVEMLRALEPREHALLQAMSRRLDPAQREALRAELLAADAPARAGLIARRAESVGLGPR